jgi:hypothetical protein
MLQITEIPYAKIELQKDQAGENSARGSSIYCQTNAAKWKNKNTIP